MTTSLDGIGRKSADARQPPDPAGDGTRVLANEDRLRRLLELSCDWYWALDAHWCLVRLDGRQVNDKKLSIQATFGKPPWEWPGVLVDGSDFAQLRSAL